ncbi:putative RNA-directed DNA polymerase from transposon BS [Nephila pilipes]|uniref:Putative RNA-directed DNA polymerase from transposon BS n=1 Tax=Nephila pilipes TaxID=299642 RepID=A0A8X6U6H2_NEPPI|nr:putative RNA-directed DNA polymerase from transposon BS [Nephila pilipes]
MPYVAVKHRSLSFRLHQRVHQDSVLIPNLFALFLARDEQVDPESCEIGIVSDGIVIWKSDSNLGKLESDINLTLDELGNYAADYALSFNPTMSTVGFFITNRKSYGFHPSIFLNYQPLTVDKHPKYLGFVLDLVILSKHIDHLVLRAKSRLKILRYILGRDWGANASTLKNISISLVLILFLLI